MRSGEMEGPDRMHGRSSRKEQAVAGFTPPEPALQQIAAEIDLDFFPLLVLHTRQGFSPIPSMVETGIGSAGTSLAFPGPRRWPRPTPGAIARSRTLRRPLAQAAIRPADHDEAQTRSSGCLHHWRGRVRGHRGQGVDGSGSPRVMTLEQRTLVETGAVRC